MQSVAGFELDAMLSKAREARRQEVLRLRRDERAAAHAQDVRRRGAELLTTAFSRAGLEREPFDKLRAENLTRLRQITQERKAEAAQHSVTSSDAQRFAFDVQRRAIELSTLRPLITPIQPGQPYPFYVWLDVPTSITATPGFNLSQQQISPFNSSARVGFDVSSDTSYAQEQLTFTFMWQNPNDVYSVINVDGYMVARGTCEATANDGWFTPDTSDVSIEAQIIPWQLWEQPPTALGGDPNSWVQILPNVHADGGTGLFGGVGDIEFRNVFRGCDLRYDLMVVPPQATAAFDLTLTVAYDIAGGSVNVDFQTKNFMVMGVGVLVAIVS
jgi:hypothetical protein